MKTSPSVTVIIPAHNAEATIAPAIMSTLNQSYQDFEIWVLENGSTDRTAEVARSFSDPRIKVFELGPVGQPGATQFAIENASSEWLAKLDADDLMFPDRLKKQMEVVREQPDLVLVGTAYARLTPFGHIFEKVSTLRSREVDVLSFSFGVGDKSRYFADGSVIFRRDVAIEVGGVDPEFTFCSNVPLFLKLLSRGRGWEIAEPLYLYRLQQGSLSRRPDHLDEMRRMRKKYAPETLRYYNERQRASNVWHSIAGLELLAGEGHVVRQAAKHLEQEGFSSDARKMRIRSYLGRVGFTYYRIRNRSAYRHRPDWEKLFAPLLQRDPQEFVKSQTRTTFSHKRQLCFQRENKALS